MQTEPADEVGRHRAKKNTKDFCNGKADRPHLWRWRVPSNYSGSRRKAPCQPYGPLTRRDMPGKSWGPWWSCNHVLECERCGKQQMLGHDKRPPCPANKNELPSTKHSLWYWKQPANEDA
jgi:hypothetical protein